MPSSICCPVALPDPQRSEDRPKASDLPETDACVAKVVQEQDHAETHERRRDDQADALTVVHIAVPFCPSDAGCGAERNHRSRSAPRARLWLQVGQQATER